MQNSDFASPVAFAQTSSQVDWQVVNGMPVASRFVDAESERLRQQTLSICDVSPLNRFGVKGPNAAAWLIAANQDIVLPTENNSWAVQDTGAVVMRLGKGEFLVEDSPQSHLTENLSNINVEAGIHPVLRNDAAFIVSGDQALRLFAEVCAIDLTGNTLAENRLVMTVVAGVSVTLLKQTVSEHAVYRLWCDGTYGAYLWHTLHSIIEELGGGAVGFNFYYEIG